MRGGLDLTPRRDRVGRRLGKLPSAGGEASGPLASRGQRLLGHNEFLISWSAEASCRAVVQMIRIWPNHNPCPADHG